MSIAAANLAQPIAPALESLLRLASERGSGAKLRAALKTLNALSDRQLEDIGVSRADLAEIGFETKTAAPLSRDAADQLYISTLR